MTPCNWPVLYTQCGTGEASDSTPCAPLSTFSEAGRKAFEDMASSLLWNWTNQVFGVCEVALRPQANGPWCRPSTFESSAHLLRNSGLQPALIGGKWYNLVCGSCVDVCSCAPYGTRSISLVGPVDEVTEVYVDGVLVPPEAYRVDGRFLIRTDGGVWPLRQDLDDDPMGEGSFLIHYTRGVPVPDGGKIAAGALACELAKASCGDTSCQLPERIQTITRQGVTVGFMDSFDSLDKGRTGIWVIDAWIASVTAPVRRAGVRSVDVRVDRRGGTPWRR